MNSAQRLIIIASLLINSTLAGCSTPTDSSPEQATIEPNQAPVVQELEATPLSDTEVLQYVFENVEDLGVCDGEFDVATSQEVSSVYKLNEEQRLIELLCFMGAYQGSYTYLLYSPTATGTALQTLNIDVAGLPTFDPSQNILTVVTKHTGSGACVETTQYQWKETDFEQISVEFTENLPGACGDTLETSSVSEEFLISEEGIGDARLGMTWGEFQQRFGTEFEFQETPLLVDFDGMAVLQNGQVQYYIVYASGTNLTNSTPIAMLYTDNPQYKTEAGVGVGTSLERASRIYGQPTLSYNMENESREFVEFANYNPNNILIRSNAGKLGEFAGIYSKSDSSYSETQRFREDSAIGAMMVLDRS